LKTKIHLLFFALTIAFILQSFGDPYSKKRITDKEFKYEFYTTDKTVRPKSKITYYWFKGGAIHTSVKGIAGELLHDEFNKFYLNNQLAESGNFKKGRKVGIWKTWYINGVLATQSEWAGGQKNGNYYSYDQDGKLIEEGMYRADKKQYKWINHITKDTIKYRNDKVVVKKVKESKEGKESNLTKKIDDPKKEKNLKEDKNQKKSNTTNPQAVKKQDEKIKKDGFFKRLFSKKDKSKTANVKGT
jgi:hypothetical protein